MGVDGSAAVLMTILKFKTTGAAAHLHDDQCNRPKAVQISVGSSRADDDQVRAIY